MKNLSCTVYAVLVLGAFGTAISGQETKVETKLEVGACNSEFAKFLVDHQVSDSRSVTQADKRVRILTRSADFLWKLDQPTARAYFSEAFKVASDHFAEKGFENKQEKGGLIIQMPDHRFEVIRAIANKDNEWARRLIEQVLKEYEKNAAERPDLDKRREIDQIMYIARQSVKTNPNLSWHLFRRIMKLPLDVHWYFALYSIAAADRRFADDLYGELLAVYRNETPRRLLFLSAYPFANYRIFGIDRFHYGTTVPENFQANPEQQQRFIDRFLRRIAAYAADPANLIKPAEKDYQPEAVYMVAALQELEPSIIERFPNMLQPFTEARALANAMLNAEMKKNLAEKEKWNEGLAAGFDERLKQLEKADEEGKLTDHMIVQLITWGESQRTEAQFAKIEPWLDKIKEESVRKATTSYFWFLRSKLAVEEGRLEDAKRYSLKVPEPEHRAILSFDIAEAQLKDLNEAASVYQTLADVGKIARQSENSIAKARVHLGLANLYERVNHIFALDELSDAIKVINRLENPDLMTSSMHRQIYGKGFSFFAGFAIPGYDLESTFRVISKNDFDMALSNAKALEDKYFRTLAVIAVAQNCIDRPKPKRAG